MSKNCPVHITDDNKKALDRKAFAKVAGLSGRAYVIAVFAWCFCTGHRLAVNRAAMRFSMQAYAGGTYARSNVTPHTLDTVSSKLPCAARVPILLPCCFCRLWRQATFSACLRCLHPRYTCLVAGNSSSASKCKRTVDIWQIQARKQQAHIPNRHLMQSGSLQRQQKSSNKQPSTHNNETSESPINPHEHGKGPRNSLPRSSQTPLLSPRQWLNSSHCCLPLHPLLRLPRPPLPASGWCEQSKGTPWNCLCPRILMHFNRR